MFVYKLNSGLFQHLFGFFGYAKLNKILNNLINKADVRKKEFVNGENIYYAKNKIKVKSPADCLLLLMHPYYERDLKRRLSPTSHKRNAYSNMIRSCVKSCIKGEEK